MSHPLADYLSAATAFGGGAIAPAPLDESVRALLAAAPLCEALSLALPVREGAAAAACARVLRADVAHPALPGAASALDPLLECFRAAEGATDEGLLRGWIAIDGEAASLSFSLKKEHALRADPARVEETIALAAARVAKEADAAIAAMTELLRARPAGSRAFAVGAVVRAGRPAVASLSVSGVEHHALAEWMMRSRFPGDLAAVERVVDGARSFSASALVTFTFGAELAPQVELSFAVEPWSAALGWLAGAGLLAAERREALQRWCRPRVLPPRGALSGTALGRMAPLLGRGLRPWFTLRPNHLSVTCGDGAVEAALHFEVAHTLEAVAVTNAEGSAR